MALISLPKITIGNAHDARARTGVTVIHLEGGLACAVDVRGGAPGTRETDALSVGGLVGRADAITLAGGSVYGLAAADEVTAMLGARGEGFFVHEGAPRSPIVGGAILFDNLNGGDKAWGEVPPHRGLARVALQGVSREIAEGASGAGFGATAGLHPGGLGYAEERVGEFTVGALIAANPVGSVFLPGSEAFWAWPWEVDGEFGGRRPAADWQLSAARDTKLGADLGTGAATVIGAVFTDADLDPAALARLAVSAQDGIAMAVQPSHTPLDGDTIFAVSTGTRAVAVGDSRAAVRRLAWLGGAAARVTARALSRGVYHGGKKGGK